MRFSIVSKASGLSFGEVDETSPAIRLQAGRVVGAHAKAPLDLAPGESVEVAYPLDVLKDEPPRQIVCVVTRIDGIVSGAALSLESPVREYEAKRDAERRPKESTGSPADFAAGVDPTPTPTEQPSVARRRRVARSA